MKRDWPDAPGAVWARPMGRGFHPRPCQRGPGPDARLLAPSPLRLCSFPHCWGTSWQLTPETGKGGGALPVMPAGRPAEAARRGVDVRRTACLRCWPAGRSFRVSPDPAGEAPRRGAKLSAVEQSSRPWGSSPLWDNAFRQGAELSTVEQSSSQAHCQGGAEEMATSFIKTLDGKKFVAI